MNATAFKMKPLPADFAIPPAFSSLTYCAADVMELAGYTDQYRFWHDYKSGKIPSGVWLPSDRPAICWARAIIDGWLAAGRPAMPGVEAHQKFIYEELLKAVRETHPEFASQFGPERN